MMIIPEAQLSVEQLSTMSTQEVMAFFEPYMEKHTSQIDALPWRTTDETLTPATRSERERLTVVINMNETLYE